MPATTVTSACNLADAREATRQIQAFLARAGLGEEFLFACELALVEACNNAVQYTPPARRHEPIVLEATCTPAAVELRVHDRTDGFDLPAAVPQPEPGIERGRGLFLMRAMMDEVTYQRSAGGNTLTLVKRRPTA
jgi:serine/threonine-protein kinase RsbW